MAHPNAVTRHVEALEAAFGDDITNGTLTWQELMARVLSAVYLRQGGSHRPTIVSNAVGAVVRGEYQ